MTLVESFAAGTPVVVLHLGSLMVIAKEGATELFFSKGEPHDLARKVEYLADHHEELRRMRISARAEFLQRSIAERGYDCLMAIYEDATRAGPHHAT